ncbi:MAG: hypothetical protein HUU35_03440 [Armatimonadetes bacterium]|nr:hypothetical protein [Armatimonadota bacterium]
METAAAQPLGALVGGLVAVVAWAGLWFYLWLLNRRLGEALATAAGPAPEAPAVTFQEASNEG